MKTMLKSALLLALIATAAQAATITQWTFETSLPNSTGAAIGPLAAEVGTGSASGVHASDLTAYVSPAGNGSIASFSSNRWAIGDYYQFATATTGFTGISISLDQTRSSTGPAEFSLSYSTNGTDYNAVSGATWSVTASTTGNITYSDTTTGNSWSQSKTATNTSVSFDLSVISALNDAASVSFRIISTSTPGSTGGTNRVDNVTIAGTAISAIPEPSSTAALAGLVVFGAVASRRRRA